MHCIASTSQPQFGHVLRTSRFFSWQSSNSYRHNQFGMLRRLSECSDAFRNIESMLSDAELFSSTSISVYDLSTHSKRLWANVIQMYISTQQQQQNMGEHPHAPFDILPHQNMHEIAKNLARHSSSTRLLHNFKHFLSGPQPEQLHD